MPNTRAPSKPLSGILDSPAQGVLDITDKANEDQEQLDLASEWFMKFKWAMVTKANYTERWHDYRRAYFGDYFQSGEQPEYKSNVVSNYIFSIIETIRPVMLDQNPKFQAMPMQPEAAEWADSVQVALDYEWYREKMNTKLYRELINLLTTGNAVFFLPWDKNEKNVKAIPVNPFNVFPDPLATCVEDAEYIIYASYYNVDKLKSLFPKSADHLVGMNVNYSELVYDNNRNARLFNQVLVLEVWTHQYDEPDKYPYGRVITIAPELGLVLADKPMPYQDKRFPFVLFKDYDVPGKFWGEGEVAQLLSPQKYMNELLNSIVDNAKATANMPWIVDKNAGIGFGKITNRPGLVIRKNPGSEVKRDQPPSMPPYIAQTVDVFKSDIEQISGVFDATKGNSATGVYTAQGILALQEAGQARIRLKVKLLEEALTVMAQLWYSRIKQFWKDERFVRITLADGSYQFHGIKKEALQWDFDMQISAGSTMPVNRGAMLDLMTRLAQTPTPDGPLVDRESVVYYLPEEVRAPLLKRMNQQNVQLTQLQQQIEQFNQQVVQRFQQDEQQEKGVIKTIDQLTSAMQQMKQQILQVEQQNDKMVADQKKQEEISQIKTSSYNDGFNDAQKLGSPSGGEAGATGSSDSGNPSQEARTGYSKGATNRFYQNLFDPLNPRRPKVDMAGVTQAANMNQSNGLQINGMRLDDSLVQQLEGMSDTDLSNLLAEHPQLKTLTKYAQGAAGNPTVGTPL